MLRFAFSQLRFRPVRAGVLAVGVIVVSVSFVVLASAARTSALRVRGSVESNYRAAYDILVRPKGSLTNLERSEGLVRPNYLSGIFGGITLAQYGRVKRISGVEVAAPIANLGFVLPTGEIPIALDTLLDDDPFQLYRVRLSWLANHGLSRYAGSEQYVYYTARDPFVGARGFVAGGERVPGRSRPLNVCAGFYLGRPYVYGPFDPNDNASLVCYSGRTPRVRFGSLERVGSRWLGTFPLLIAAIDPIQEARLVRLDRAVVNGRYLRGSDRPKVVWHQPTPPFRQRTGKRYVPVLVSSRTYVDESLEAQIERLQLPSVDLPQRLASAGAYRFLTGLHGSVVERRRLSLEPAYERMLAGNLSSLAYWTISPVNYRQVGSDPLVPSPVRNPIDVWRSPFVSGNGGFYSPPPSNRDIQFRRLAAHAGQNGLGLDGVWQTPAFRIVGRYDPANLPSFSALSRVPLETYEPPLLEAADRTTARALRGRPLAPTQNLGEYIAQPPLILTTLAGMKPLLDPEKFSGASGRAPISVIRVRVGGLNGSVRVNEARVRRVAIDIHRATGLSVDITAGSSPRPLEVRLTPGRFGRPQLLLREGWSKKGISVAFLDALDRKSLSLLVLILVVGAFFIANGAFAVVRARRSEIGTLLCVGWSRRAIFGAIVGEVAVISFVAGAVGVAVAAASVAVFDLDLPVARTLLVLPVAVLLTVLAGIVPAARAARAVPLDAVLPAVAGGTSRTSARRLTVLALANVRRLPARTLVPAGALAVGVGALTLLVGINRGFEGTLVSTLLGKAISLQVRGIDLVSVGIVIALAALALADVLVLNLRERASELATLRAVGWRERDLQVLVGLEAGALGIAGAAAGAAAGFAAGLTLDVPLEALGVGAAAGAAGGLVVVVVTTLARAAGLRAVTPAAVLARE